MECLLHLAASLCLLSPSGLTLHADVSTQTSGDFHYVWAGKDYGGAHVGRVALSMPLLAGRHFSIDAGYAHESLLDTGRDRGQERVSVGITFRPFGAR